MRIDGNNTDELLDGGAADDEILGNGGNDTLRGFGGYDYLEGGAGDDSLVGGDEGDYLVGGAGNDTLDGSTGGDESDEAAYDTSSLGVFVNLAVGTAQDGFGGTDTLLNIERIRGGSGNDTLIGDGGQNNLIGLAGNDVLNGGDGDRDRVDYRRDVNYGGTQGVVVDLEAGTAKDGFGNIDTLIGIERIRATDVADIIRGDASNNLFEGRGGADTFDGRSGDDGFNGGRGADTYNGGSGWDRVEYDWDEDAAGSRGVYVNLASGTGIDTFGAIETYSFIEEIQGSIFNDTLIGGSLDNRLGGGDGNDQIDGGAGNDGLRGAYGNDSLIGGVGDDYMRPGAGDDTVRGGAGWDTVAYSDDDDAAVGIVVSFSAAGTATVFDWSGGTDSLFGTERVRGTDFADTMTGSAGRQSLSGEGGNDTLSGGDGDDDLEGGYGNDSLIGGVGDDYMRPGAGDDTVRGGAGWDTVAYSDDDDAAVGIVVSFSAAGTATVFDWSGGTDSLFGTERVRGTDFADTMTGSAGRQSLSGEGGNDTLSGGDGDDELEGGTGNDSLSGGAGGDWLHGGAGGDTLDGGTGENRVSYRWDLDEGGAAGVTVNLNAGTATDGFGNSDILVSIQNVDGTQQNDLIIGDADENDLIGDGGNDTLIGGGGNDYLEGGDGNDRLDGSGTGEIWGDYIRPGLGSNTIIGSQSLFETLGDGIDISYSGLRGIGGLTITIGASGIGTTISGTPGLVNDTFTYAHYFIGSQDDDVIESIDEPDDDAYRFEGFTGHDGADTIIGGTFGADRIDYRNEQWENPNVRGVLVNLTTGRAIDTYGKIDTLVGIEEVRGTHLADRFTGSASPDQNYSFFEGLNGADTIIGTNGYDIIKYSQDFDEGGTQAIIVDLVAGTVKDGFGAIDTVSAIDAVHGTRLNDWIRGDAIDNWLRGFEGNDTIIGGGGADELLGGLGDDRLIGGGGADLLDGEDGFDIADYSNQTLGLVVNLGTPASNTGIAAGDSFVGIEGIVGGSGNDTLTGDGVANRLGGSSGNDILTGAGGNDTLNGGNGNDVLEGGSGNDLLNGGLGFDRVLFTGSNAVSVNLGLLTAQDAGYGLDTFLDIEAVTSGSGTDLLIGNALANALNGGLGDDTIRGGAGNDTVNGADGNDALTGGGGNDLIIGGAGSDTAVFAGAAAVVSLALLGAQSTGVGFDTLSGIENLTGGTFADQLTGDGLANRLEGDAGNDTLAGAAGDDTLLGGLGDDRLGGGLGNDLLEGGLGTDQFVFNTGGGNDFVTDFQDGFDRIRIGTGAESFVDLVLSEIGLDTVVTFSDVTITLAGIAQSQITDSDFVFV